MTAERRPPRRDGKAPAISRENRKMSEKIDVENYFGGCPQCGKTDGYVNVREHNLSTNGPAHWFRCDAHRTKWCVGANLMSVPEEGNNDRRQAEAIDGYTEVEPLDRIM
jgi:hypothetical protein